MNTLGNKLFLIRKVVAVAIIIHGLYRVITISGYVDNVAKTFDGVIENASILILVATILPFLEFLSGALLFMRVGVRQSAILAGAISLFMVLFIFLGRLHVSRYAYHILIIAFLIYIVYAYRPIILNEREFNLSKCKINSRTNYFFRFW